MTLRQSVDFSTLVYVTHFYMISLLTTLLPVWIQLGHYEQVGGAKWSTARAGPVLQVCGTDKGVSNCLDMAVFCNEGFDLPDYWCVKNIRL